MEFKRNCPLCNIEILYKRKQSFQLAISENKKCKKCSKINLKKKVEVEESYIKQILFNKLFHDFELIFAENKFNEILNIVDFEFTNMTARDNHVNTIYSKSKRYLKLPDIGSNTKKYWISRGWTVEEAEIKRRKIIKKEGDSPMQKLHWINKGYSEDDAEFKVKSMRPINKEHWINKGYSEDDAIKKVLEVQSNNGYKLSKKRKLNPSKYHHISPNNINYWIKKENCTIEEAKEKVSEWQARGLTYLQDKYGKEEGLDKHIKRTKLWKSKVFNKDTWIGQGSSIISKNFIEILLNKDLDISNFLYGKNEKFIRHKSGAFKYDLTDQINKKIIEFNGDYWHCNPNSNKEYSKRNYFHKVKKMTAEEIWKYDKEKIELAELHGYRIKVIWEKDFRENPDKVIEECINFLKK